MVTNEKRRKTELTYGYYRAHTKSILLANIDRLCKKYSNTEDTDQFIQSHQGFNPIALRKAKIVCSFGLSECSRVKLFNVSL